MRQRPCLSLLMTLLAVASVAAQDSGVIVFKSSVEQVAVAAIVRDSRGRLVTNLKASDFELIDEGQKRTLTNVWSEPSPASVAILMDASGSMATKMDRARETADALVAGLKPGTDEVAMFAFDTSLKEVRPFSSTFNAGDGTWSATKAYGATSLWDAIAETSQKISDRQRRRVLVVITDVSTRPAGSRLMCRARQRARRAGLYAGHHQLVNDDSGEPQPIRGPLADFQREAAISPCRYLARRSHARC
jgi:VWFA-related protein